MNGSLHFKEKLKILVLKSIINRLWRVERLISVGLMFMWKSWIPYILKVPRGAANFRPISIWSSVKSRIRSWQVGKTDHLLVVLPLETIYLGSKFIHKLTKWQYFDHSVANMYHLRICIYNKNLRAIVRISELWVQILRYTPKSEDKRLFCT